MNLLFWALTVGVIGKVLLAVGVLKAHSELAHERRVDLEVIKTFAFERVLTITGLVLIVAGYIMEIYFYDFVSMLTCAGPDCALNATAFLSR